MALRRPRPRIGKTRIYAQALAPFILAVTGCLSVNAVAQSATQGTAWPTDATHSTSESAASTTTAESDDAPQLSLAAAWEKALASSPGLRAAQSGAAAAEGAVLQSQAHPNPEISYSQEDTRSPTRSSTLQVNQLIELGGKRDARTRVALSEQAGAHATAFEALVNLRYQLVTCFNELLLAQQRLAYAKQVLELATRAHDAAQKRVTAGKVPPLEATRAQVAQAQARLEQDQAQSSILLAKQNLAALWGGSAHEIGQAAGDFVHTAAPPSAEQIDTLLERAPAMVHAGNALEQSRAISELERARRMQDLTLSLGVKRSQELGRNQIVFGISMPLPLFDRNTGNQLQALRKVEQAELSLQDQRLQMRVQLLTARQQLISSNQQADQLQNLIIPTAQSAYDVAARGFTLGKFNFLEVLDAQRTLFETQRQLLAQLMASHKAQAEIDRLLGTSFTATAATRH